MPCVELVDWGWNLVCDSLQIQQWNTATSVIEIAYASFRQWPLSQQIKHRSDHQSVHPVHFAEHIVHLLSTWMYAVLLALL